MSYFSVTGLSKRFGGLQAVNDCGFEIKQGIITCLIGPNGAGKTTIFNLLTGFYIPDAGKVMFQGQDLIGRSPQDIVGMGIARSFQNLRLFQESTVLENVLIGLPNQPDEGPLTAFLAPIVHRIRSARKAARDQAMGILDEVGLADKANLITKNLPYGEQKLLCVARLLATGADLLMLDEPASGLDAEALDRVVALLMKLKAQGKTIMLIEHNAGLVRNISDELLFLHQGQLIARGDPETIFSDPQLTEIYFGGGAVLHH